MHITNDEKEIKQYLKSLFAPDGYGETIKVKMCDGEYATELKKLREAAGVSRKKIHIETGVPQPWYSNLENGKCEKSNPIRLYAVAVSIGCMLHEIANAPSPYFQLLNSRDHRRIIAKKICR